ncbi:aBC transporter ATPase component [Firmicutes bacterium CAG:345]|jgi:ABC superfamily ATP binding cassette transporter, ABC protein|nr:aBC transporter ATPase component [Firmicutes bacterium CAG:345]
MYLLSATGILKEFQGEPLTSPLTFNIDENEKIALIGSNGCGKSTLIKMLIGELEPDKGHVTLSKNCTIGYLSQSVISDLSHTLYEEAEEVFKPLMEEEKFLEDLCEKIAEDPSNTELLDTYSHREPLFREKDGYNFRYKIRLILNYFKFKEEDYNRPITSFSGGERMKIAFAKLLLLNPSLLILDEPTNHLDISTIEWLEEYLKSYKGAILFVSHDRYFINSLATRVLEIEKGKLESYSGNYDKYAAEKKVRYESQLKLYLKEEKQKQKLEWFIKFYMPKPRFVSRAHDREKKLARLEKTRVEKPTEVKNKVHIDFQGKLRVGKRVFETKELAVGYDKPLISDIEFSFFGGDKLAIMGDNGSGKTTFIKTLLGKIKPYSGKICFYDNFNIGYLPQDGLLIRSNKTVLDYFRDLFPLLTLQEVYNTLGAFDFSREDDEKIVDNLSGGEKMRLVLSTLVEQKYDILVLDEPTNHLDMMTKEELIEAIGKYKGSIIIISHDRSFVDNLCNCLLYFENNKAYYYQGDYSHFKVVMLDDILQEKLDIEKARLEEERKQDTLYHLELEKARVKFKDDKPLKPRPKLAKNKIEEKMARLERLIGEDEVKLDDPEYYWDQSKLNALQEELDNYNKEYEELMEMLSLYDQ